MEFLVTSMYGSYEDVILKMLRSFACNKFYFLRVGHMEQMELLAQFFLKHLHSYCCDHSSLIVLKSTVKGRFVRRGKQRDERFFSAKSFRFRILRISDPASVEP